ncbi:hypothetical protein D9M72_495010 [compost metagenome]
MRHLGHLDLVAECGEPFQHVLADAAFSLEAAHLVETAGAVDRLLHVHAEIDDVGQHVALPNRLEAATHHPEGEPRLALLHRHGRNDGVQRAFARPHAIGVGGIDAKADAAVLQQNTGLRAAEAGAVRPEQRIDEGTGVALFVDDADVDGVAIGGGTGWTNRRHGLLQVDAAAQIVGKGG